MDFNVKRLAADAGTFLSRAVQVQFSADVLAQLCVSVFLAVSWTAGRGSVSPLAS